jgi:hypothetical protein
VAELSLSVKKYIMKTVLFSPEKCLKLMNNKVFNSIGTKTEIFIFRNLTSTERKKVFASVGIKTETCQMPRNMSMEIDRVFAIYGKKPVIYAKRLIM